MRMAFSLMAMLCLAACVVPREGVDKYLYYNNIRSVEPNLFDICHAYGCQRVQRVEASDKLWKQIDKVFKGKTKSAAQERERIADSIGVFEQYVGALTGTDVDKHGTFIKHGEFQQDCVDESTNTTVYLTLLQKRGYLKFHEITDVEARSPFKTGRWWHQTATVRDLETGQRYAVDSWFENNGYPAYIVPYEIWEEGWKPAEPHWMKEAGGNQQEQ